MSPHAKIWRKLENHAALKVVHPDEAEMIRVNDVIGYESPPTPLTLGPKGGRPSSLGAACRSWLGTVGASGG
jgi:hypothetical protein